MASKESDYDPKVSNNCIACKRKDDWDNLIECSTCRQWYHYKCAKIMHTVAENEEFTCELCEEGSEETVVETNTKETSNPTISRPANVPICDLSKNEYDTLELERKKEMYELELKYINLRLQQNFTKQQDFKKQHIADKKKPESITRYYEEIQKTNYRPRVLTRDQLAARHSLDKVKLPSFDGNPEDWLRFICNYEHSTAECGYSNIENMARLSECLRGKALDHVRSCLSSPDMIPVAIETLRMLYGRPELIITKLKSNILKAPPVKDITQSIEFALKVQHLCTAIESTKIPEYLFDYSLIQELLNKLPDTLKLQWASHIEEEPMANLSKFSIWLLKIAQLSSKVVLYEDKPSRVGQKPQRISYGSANIHSSDVSQTNSKSEHFKCALCQTNQHALNNCNRFEKKSINERWNVVKDQKLCRTCLSHHNSRFCRNSKECGIDKCTKKHHQLLHKKVNMNTEQTETTNQMSSRENLMAAHMQSSANQILFKVIPIKIYGKKGVHVETLAFIDEGASISIIEQNLANKLGINGKKEQLRLNWTSGMFRTEPKSERIKYEISGVDDDSRHEIEVRTVSKLQLPEQQLDTVSHYEHLKDLNIHQYAKARPQILLGLDNYHIVFPIECRQGNKDEPMAFKTKLGWTIFGKNSNESQKQSVYINHMAVRDSENFDENVPSSVTDQNLHELVKEFFSVESFGVRSAKEPVSTAEQRALDIMQKTTNRVGERFETGLLWKEENVMFPDNYQMAVKRMISFEHKLSKDPTMKQFVNQQIIEYMKKGYIRKLKPEERQRSERTWYLPIFTVKNQNKPGKYRIVWDAAAKYSGVSFNSKMLTGPDLISPLPGILNRFREGHFAISGDISEMYHQVKVLKSDQDCQRFLFRQDTTSSPETYIMQVLTFGSACSPSSAIFTMNENARQHLDENQRALSAITRNHYIDDWLDSANSEKDLLKLATEVKHTHSKGGFSIGKWISNSSLVTQKFKLEKSSRVKNIGQTNDRVLGIWWDTHTDTFNFSINKGKFEKDLLLGRAIPTKRQYLRALMSIYDPLGIIAHIIILGKIILQEIWRTKLEWDDEIHKPQFQKWLQWIKILREVEHLQIPRAYTLLENNGSAELHVFSDASENAFATVAYWRFTQNEKTEVTLIGAKTRVAPTKILSIPRLELQGAILATRFAKSIEDSHTIKMTKRFFWCDSTNVLSWIRSDARRYKQFVAVRIGEILDSSNVAEWKYVPSKLNVADDATKWQTTPVVSPDHRWFKGPEFLHHHESQWPMQKDHTQQIDTELKAHLMCISTPQQEFVINLQRFSNYKKAVRVTAYVLRAVQNFKQRKGNRILSLRYEDVHPVTSSEFTSAEELLIRNCQQHEFLNEIEHLRKFNNIDRLKSCSKIYKLSPYLDEKRIIRMRGRIDEAKVTFETKRPIILPNPHPLTTLIAASYHDRYLHKNFETSLNEIRRRFEILRIRPLMKSIRRDCVRCKILYANPKPAIMGPLPSSRLAAFEHPFSHIGLDYFGPFYISIGRKTEKRWGMLTTCMTIRAIHLEVAESLSTDSCIMALRRTFAIRGTPKTITCDRGTNFRGASRELHESIKNVDEKELIRFFHQSEWKFIPPHSPHMGGVWERLVRTVKSNLSEILYKQRLSEEVLRTAFHEVTQIINSRPLTDVPVETHNQPAITPNDLLNMSSVLAKPPGEIIEPDRVINIRLWKSWKRSQILANNFWKRWIREYLPTLRKRTKWFTNTKPIEVNDIVILCDENLPRCSWPKGIVIKINRGKDQIPRSADVKVIHQDTTTVYTRPITKLAILDVGKPTPNGNVVNLPGGTVVDSNFIIDRKF